jgi:hypothetical protein
MFFRISQGFLTVFIVHFALFLHWTPPIFSTLSALNFVGFCDKIHLRVTIQQCLSSAKRQASALIYIFYRKIPDIKEE